MALLSVGFNKMLAGVGRTSRWIVIPILASLIPLAGTSEAADFLTLFIKPDDITRLVTSQVAAVARPNSLIARPGESVDDVVRRSCGSVPPGYLELLKGHGSTGLPAGFTGSSKFIAATPITVPGCLTVTQPAATAAANSQAWSSIELKNSVNPQLATAKVQKAIVSSGQAPAAVADSTDIQIYGEVSSEELAALHACQPGSIGRSPYDLVEVLQVLAFDLQSLQAGQRGGSANIVIPDTGLYAGKVPFTTDRIQHLNASNDPNDPYSGIRPYTDQADNNHGTYVATVALGGPEFMRLTNSLDVRLRVAPLNMLSPQGQSCLIDGNSAKCPLVKPDAFLNAARNAEDIDAIVNLSVGRATKFAEIQDRLSLNSHVLFVVAAGNDHSDLATRQVYPARYGGSKNDGRLNLLTVAATDFDGHRAAFSNFGADYVDLAAPGCALPVLRHNAQNDAFDVTRASGTSFAAPMVSFAAALLQTVWPHVTPHQLRTRILVSANISSLLDPTEVADSRTLDIGKALSIYEDVVDGIVDGKHVRVRGRIDPQLTLFDFCSGQVSLYRSSGLNQKRIRKIAAVTKPNAGFLLYWESDDGVFDGRVCPRQSITVSILDDFTNTKYDFADSNITDVVFAEEH